MAGNPESPPTPAPPPASPEPWYAKHVPELLKIIGSDKSSGPTPSEDANIVGYALLTASGYEGLVTVNPTVAFYLGLLAGVAFTISNRLAKYGY